MKANILVLGIGLMISVMLSCNTAIPVGAKPIGKEAEKNIQKAGFPIFISRGSQKLLVLFNREGSYSTFVVRDSEIKEHQKGREFHCITNSTGMPGRPVWYTEKGVLISCLFAESPLSGYFTNQVGLVPILEEDDWLPAELAQAHRYYRTELKILHRSFHPETVARKTMISKEWTEAIDRTMWTQIGDSKLVLWTKNMHPSLLEKSIKALEGWEKGVDAPREIQGGTIFISDLTGRALPNWNICSICAVQEKKQIYISASVGSVGRPGKLMLFESAFSPEEGFGAFKEIGQGVWSLCTIHKGEELFLMGLEAERDEGYYPFFREPSQVGKPVLLQKVKDGDWKKTKLKGVAENCVLLASAQKDTESFPYVLSCHASEESAFLNLSQVDLKDATALPALARFDVDKGRMVQSADLVVTDEVVTIAVHTIDIGADAGFGPDEPEWNDATNISFYRIKRGKKGE